MLAGGALGGAVAAAAIVLLQRPGLGFDSLAYHLPEALGWMRSGRPGSVDLVEWNLPVGNYPLTSEVGLTWLLALTRSFAPVALLAPALVGLAALALGAAARWLGAPRWAAIAAATSFLALPLVTSQLAAYTAGSDLPALAAVLCGLALAARADAHPALLGPALVAVGLAVGTKTTAAPLGLGVVALGIVRTRGRGPLPRPVLGLAALLALAVGAPWYVRNTLEHGWPLWPFARGPTGDPRPAALAALPDSLLGAPHRTLAGHVGEYLGRLAGGTLLLTAAPAVALVARRRRVVLAAAATVVGVLLWAAAPVTGRSADPSAAYGLPVATTCFANLYGGGDQNRSRLEPEAVAAALGGRAPVIRSDGSPRRDFIYVEDAVTAYLALADALDGDGARGEAFNAGGGEPHSVLEVVELVCRAAGTEVAPDVRGTGTPAGEIDAQWVDAFKLRALTGWMPGVGLEDGLERTVEWYRAHPRAL